MLEVDALTEEICEIIRLEQGFTRPVTANARICSDLGVCDGDFEDLLESLWTKFIPGYDRAAVVRLPFSEHDATAHTLAEHLAKEAGKVSGTPAVPGHNT